MPQVGKKKYPYTKAGKKKLRWLLKKVARKLRKVTNES